MGGCSSSERGSTPPSSSRSYPGTDTRDDKSPFDGEVSINNDSQRRLIDEEERTICEVGTIVDETKRMLEESGRLVNTNEIVLDNLFEPIIPTFPINFILFSDYKALGRTPRYPDDADICRHYDSINLEETFVIFISHCWLRGWNGAQDFDGRPHPDTVNHDKYQLTVIAIEKLISQFAPGFNDCAVWLDYGCINQDGDPCGELNQLDAIIQFCDCMLTPIYEADTNAWQMPLLMSNYYEDYKSPYWMGNTYSYLSRAWCRVEMFYASNIPVPYYQNSPARLDKFSNALKIHLQEGRRPHILYGSKLKNEFRTPLILPPLQNSWFNSYNPCNGSLTQESDRAKIRELVDILTPFMKSVTTGYTGEKDSRGQMHGVGRYVYNNGDSYVGQWVNSKYEGLGKYRWSIGDEYIGSYAKHQRNGKGLLKLACGDTYTGEFKMDLYHGFGVYVFQSGEYGSYRGYYEAGRRHGFGEFKYTSGDRFIGNIKFDLYDGNGKYIYKNGVTYEGNFSNSRFNGKGKMTWPGSGDIFEGNFVDWKKNGPGKLTRKNGEVIHGIWKDDYLVQ